MFNKKVRSLNETYPGGLKAYTTNARSLLEMSKLEINPYEDYEVEIPLGEKVTVGDNEEFHALEAIGRENLKYCCFVLVAGGLGERLGYDGIKIGIPLDLIT